MLIVIPVYRRHGFYRKCLLSVIKDLKLSKNKHKLVIVNNGFDELIKDYTEYMLNDGDVPFVLINRDNEGKAVAVNDAVNRYGDSNILCSLDGDMEIVSEHFFDTMEDTYKIAMSKFKIDVLCSDQTGNSYQNYRALRQKRVVNGKIIYYNARGNGVGGCLAIDMQLFKDVGGYRADTGVFGGNDGFLVQDVHKLTGGYIGLLKNAVVNHPHPEDNGYEEWKKEILTKVVETGYGVSKGYWD